MISARITRLPRRIKQDIKIIGLAKNWNEILSAKLTRSPLRKIELRNGVVLSSPPEVSLNFLFHEIWLDEVYLPQGYEIRPNDTVIDIGANIGVFAFYAATRASNVKVHSYEPFPKNAEYFEQNLEKSSLPTVSLHKFAVAGETGERVLHIDEAWIKHSLSESPSDENGISVRCLSLDEVLENIDKCDMLKLDCEGSEYEILFSSSPETLGKIKRIVGEFHELDKQKKNGNGLKRFLEENGFKIDVFRYLEGKSGLICARNEV